MNDKMPGMKRRSVFLPDELWEWLQERAIELTVREGAPVSRSEVMRRVLERSRRQTGG